MNHDMALPDIEPMQSKSMHKRQDQKRVMFSATVIPICARIHFPYLKYRRARPAPESLMAPVAARAFNAPIIRC